MEVMADWTTAQSSSPSLFLIMTVQTPCRYTHMFLFQILERLQELELKFHLNVIFRTVQFYASVCQDSSFPAPDRLYKVYNYPRTQSRSEFLILAHVLMVAQFVCKLAKTSQLGESFPPQARNISINAGDSFPQKQFLIITHVLL